MAKKYFEFVRCEAYTCTYRVAAENEDEARELILQGEYDEYEGGELVEATELEVTEITEL